MHALALTEEIVFSFLSTAMHNAHVVWVCSVCTMQIKHGYFSFHYRPQHNFSIKGVYGKILTFYTHLCVCVFLTSWMSVYASYDLKVF